MSFQPLNRRVVKTTDPVRVSLSRRQEARRIKTLIYISLSAHCAQAMGWHPGQLIEVAVGDGADTGTIRLKATTDRRGYTLRHSHKSTRLQILLDYWGREETYRQAAAEARPDMLAKALTVSLPWHAKRLQVVA